MENHFEKVKFGDAQKIEVSKEVKEAVEKILDNLHNKANEKVNVDKQCLSRFGMSWDDVRKNMQEKLLSGFELIPSTEGHKGLRVEPEFAIKGLAECTGNWMTNKFLEVLYLSYSKSEWFKQACLKKMNENPDVLDKWDLLDIAPDIAPEKVEEVLRSYGLDMQKGYRMTGIEIDIGGSRNIELE